MLFSWLGFAWEAEGKYTFFRGYSWRGNVCSITLEYFSLLEVNFFVVHSKALSLCKLNLDKN